MIPKLRFPEFTEAWSEKSIGDVATISRGRFSPRPRNDPRYYGGDTEFIQTSEVVGANPYILNGSKSLNEEGVKVSKVFPSGTIVMTIAANIGYVGFANRPIAFPDSLVGINAFKEILPKYLFYVLSRKQRRLDYIAEEAAQKNITSPTVRKFKIWLTTNQKEQVALMNLFELINSKINLLNKKKEALETYKKGLVQKIFSQELRFKREDGTDYPEWRIASLGEVSEVIMGQSPSSSSYNELGQGLPLAQGKADFEDSVFNSVRYTSEPTKVIPAKTILMSVRAPVGFIGYADREVCIGRGMCAIKTAHMSYIHAYLTFYQTEWRKIQQGSTFEAVSGKDIKDVKVPMPTSELEERSITECFNLIDNKTKAISNLLNNTLSLKKGLLQQMFV